MILGSATPIADLKTQNGRELHFYKKILFYKYLYFVHRNR